MTHEIPPRRLAALVLVPWLILPSIAKAQRYGGALGMLAYALLATASLLAFDEQLRAWARRIPARRADAIAAITIIACAVLYGVLHPLADRGIGPGGGSDRDEALDAAVREMLAGRYPYRIRTYAGNPISPMPGELLIATPFVLLGQGALQNLAWLGALYGMARRTLAEPGVALLALAYPLVFSPVVLHELVTGGDLLANALWVSISTLLMVRSAERRATIASFALAVVWGIGLSSRAHFLFVVPPVLASIASRVGWRSATTHGAMGVVSFVAVTLPFWAFSPSEFSPMHIGERFSVLASAHITSVLATSAVVSIALALRAPGATERAMLWACALAVNTPVILATITACVTRGPALLERYAWYALSGLFFAVLAFLIGGRPPDAARNASGAHDVDRVG